MDFIVEGRTQEDFDNSRIEIAEKIIEKLQEEILDLEVRLSYMENSNKDSLDSWRKEK